MASDPEPELRPCPSCKSTDVVPGLRVYCADCGMQGPGRRRSERLRLWNALPRAEDIERLERERDELRRQCWTVAELATEDHAGEKWTDEDKGDYLTDLLMRAGVDVMQPVTEPAQPAESQETDNPQPRNEA